MSWISIAEREGTQLWQGDVVVVGASLGGVAAALAARESGRRVCLLESGPTLGTELTAAWRQSLPEDPLVARLRALCRDLGAPAEGPVDILLGTLALDRIVGEAGVDAFVKVVPGRVLQSESGVVTGVEVVGKSGRQAVVAPLVIDATAGQALFRRALGLPLPRRTRVCRRLYVAGMDVPPGGEIRDVPPAVGLAGNRVDARPAAWPGEAILTVSLDAGDASWSTLMLRSVRAGVAAFAYLRRHVASWRDAILVDISPGLTEEFPEDDEASAAAVGGLAALPLVGDLSRQIVAGRELGRRHAVAPGTLPPCPPPSGELLASAELRAAPEQDLPPLHLPPASARRHEFRDVVVAGYGTGGTFAAIAAAQRGVRVAVLDPSPLPGGIGSAGRIHSYYHGLSGGLQDGFDEAIAGRAADLGRARGYHPVGRADVLARALEGDRLEVFAGHTVFGVILEGSRVTGVVSSAADGYHVFPCQVAIDGTGDGDLAAAAGATMVLGRDGDGFPQPYSYTPTSVGNGELRHHNYDAGWVDPTDTIDFSRAHFEGRLRVTQRGPFGADRHFCTLAPILGLRESRFARGALTLTFEDFLQGRTFPDTVCSAYAHHDNHAMDYAEESDWARRHVVMFGLWRYLCHGDVPYRVLTPAGVDGILLACRALSVDHDLHQLLRMQRDLQVLGEVCGVAAAEAVRRGVAPRDVPIDALKAILEGRGIRVKAPAKALDLPQKDLFEALRREDHDRGLAMWRLSLRGPEADWDRFFGAETDPGARFCAAVAAAVGGVCRDDVVGELRRAVAARAAEPPLGVKSPARCVVAALALAALRTDDAAAASGELLGEARPAPEVLLLLGALATAGRPEGIAVVRRFLAEHEDAPFPVPLWGVEAAHPASFRAFVILRALRTLAALGSADEEHRLEPYLNDASLLLRRHARRVQRELQAVRI
ncbi:MAG: FAD-dependent oxidoreductase [Lentisphaeria bacterium]|nr:FAD-dependent oxidoreductase [Lentisphaeria bacterium]